MTKAINTPKKTAQHRNATTTPEMRQFIQESDFSVSQLAKILNISEATVRKWRKRESISDTPNTPHHLKTTLSPMEEYVVVGLRYQLKMPLDRLLQVTQRFINPHVSRSGLARCLKRYGVSRLDEFESPYVPEKFFNQLSIKIFFTRLSYFKTIKVLFISIIQTFEFFGVCYVFMLFKKKNILGTKPVNHFGYKS